ncbi:hypothetical protein FACS1894105_04280 [Clostridia bacterium]|nr:hypothetical protein FACS1894105_04280 [Clostridia bacterium]
MILYYKCEETGDIYTVGLFQKVDDKLKQNLINEPTGIQILSRREILQTYVEDNIKEAIEDIIDGIPVDFLNGEPEKYFIEADTEYTLSKDEKETFTSIDFSEV